MEGRRGVVRGFDRGTWTADVELRGFQSTRLTAVPVAQHVRWDLMVDGAQCVVLLLDPSNPTDAVVVALLGEAPALDPKFDPVLGHKHRGLEDDGPELS